MAVDLGVFGRHKTLMDMQQLHDAFEAKKAFEAQRASGVPTQEDLLRLGIQQQNHADEMAYRQAALEQARQIAMMNNQTRLDDKQIARDTKKEQSMYKAQSILDSVNAQYDAQINNADELLKMPSLKGVVGMVDGRLTGFTQGQTNAINKYDTLVSASMINGLQSLKENSPTGASGFGSLTEKEGDIIRKAQGTLQRTSDEEEFKKNLLAYRQKLEESKARVGKSFMRQFGDTQSPASAPATVHWDDLK